MEGRHYRFATMLLVAASVIIATVVFLSRSNHTDESENEFLVGDSNAAECPKLVWSDQFEGSELDTNNWEYELGNGCNIGVCGWGNAEWQVYTDKNAIVSNGTLKIVAHKEQAKENPTALFTSSRIRTIHKAEFLYGRFEARIKLPIGQGIWPAFWMMPTDGVYGTWPRSGEIDIMENIGHEHSTVHGTVHYSDNPSSGNHLYSTHSVNLFESQRFTDDYHEFAVEKLPGRIQWLLDGSPYFIVTNETVSHWPFEEEFHFILNVAIGGEWPGYPDETTKFPQLMEVDHVQVWDISERSTLGKLFGPRVVQSNQQMVIYSLKGSTIWDSFQWDVPDDSSVASQDNSTISINFGKKAGTVKVTAYSATCAIKKEFSISVTVGSTVDLVFVDGADTINEKATLVSANGNYQIVSNPHPHGAINPSKNVIQYVRNGGDLYDSIIFDVPVIINPKAYVQGKREFSLDVLTSSPPGTEVILQLENSDRANPSNYPIGRFCRLGAVIPDGIGDQWRSVIFAFLDQPDADEEKVDRIIILFAPNTLSSETFYFDNLESFSVLSS